MIKQVHVCDQVKSWSKPVCSDGEASFLPTSGGDGGAASVVHAHSFTPCVHEKEGEGEKKGRRGGRGVQCKETTTLPSSPLVPYFSYWHCLMLVVLCSLVTWLTSRRGVR